MKNPEWGEGPWDHEPDGGLWTYLGYPCAIKRNPTLGHLCGYVGVPESHPWYGKDYGDLEVSIHGGLTYGRGCDEYLPTPNGFDGPTWWFGFDCGHYTDVTPSQMVRRALGSVTYGQIYRDFEYVKAQVNALADQARTQE